MTAWDRPPSRAECRQVASKVSTFKHSKSKERSDVEGLEEGGDAHLCKTTTLISLPAMFLVCVFMTCCEYISPQNYKSAKSNHDVSPCGGAGGSSCTTKDIITKFTFVFIFESFFYFVVVFINAYLCFR